VRLEASIGARTVAIYADLALANNPVNAAPGQVTQQLVDEVVEALAGLILGHFQVPYTGPLPPGLLLRHIDLTVRHCFYKSFGSILARAVRNCDGQWLAAFGDYTKAPSRRMLVGPPNRGHRIGPTRSRGLRRTSCKDSAGSAVG
jgi:hypothetical protein